MNEAVEDQDFERASLLEPRLKALEKRLELAKQQLGGEGDKSDKEAGTNVPQPASARARGIEQKMQRALQGAVAAEIRTLQASLEKVF